MMELKRIFLNKSIIIGLSCLLILTIWFFIYQETPQNDNFTLNQYSSLYNDTVSKCQEMPDKEAIEWLKAKEHEAKACVALQYFWQNYNENSEDDEILAYYKEQYPEYLKLGTNLPLSEKESYLNLEVYSQILNQYEYIDDYSDDYDQMRDNAKEYGSVSIFANKSSFSYRNIQKTLSDYSGIQNATLSIGNNNFITTLYKDSIVDYFIILFQVIICLALLKERTNGLWNTVYASPNGRISLGVKRIFILFLGAAISCVILLGGKMLTSLCIYGSPGDMSRTLQSIEMFRNVPGIITINQYFWQYFLIKIGGTFAIGLCIYAIMSGFTNIKLSILFVTLFLSMQFTLFKFVRDSSVLVPLRYLNLFSVVEYSSVNIKYLNINILGMIIEGNLLIYIFIPLVAVIAAIITIMICARKRPFSQLGIWLKISNKISLFTGRFSRSHRLLYFEYKKSLVTNKGIFIILIMIAYFVFYGVAPPIDYNSHNSTATYYKSQIEGELTSDTYAFVEGETKNLQQELVELDISNPASSFKQEEIIQKLQALEVVASEIDRLELLKDTSGINGYIMDTTLYDAIFNDNILNYQQKNSLIVILFMILLLSNVFSYEKQKRMKYLLRSSCYGRQKLWLTKLVVAFTLSFVVWLTVYGTEIILAISRYGAFHSTSAPIQSLGQFTNLAKDISIKSYLCALYLYRFFIILVLSSGILLISELLNNTKSSLIFNIIVFLVPSALVATGIDSISSLTFIKPLSQVRLFYNSTNLYILILLLPFLFINYIMFCKINKPIIKKNSSSLPSEVQVDGDAKTIKSSDFDN